MNILIDMNLTPKWAAVLTERGHRPVHWSSVGAGDCTDIELMRWARNNAHVLLTCDLDFGAILAFTGASGPSVVQLRVRDPRPNAMASTLLAVLDQCRTDLEAGSLVVVDEARVRVRILPLDQAQDMA